MSLAMSHIALENFDWEFQSDNLCLSMWIQNSAIHLVFSTSKADVCFCDPRWGGIFTRMLMLTTLSWMSKPLSAIIVSVSQEDHSSLWFTDLISAHLMLQIKNQQDQMVYILLEISKYFYFNIEFSKLDEQWHSAS